MNKKQAAAMAAVVSYLKTEQEAAALQAAATSALEPAADTFAFARPLKMWGLSGRQAQMQLRHMMQMKTFK